MTLTFERPLNPNYAATVIELGQPHELDGLDNLVGFPVFGNQALTVREHKAGDLMVAFTVETQLSEEFARENNLFRDAALNADPEETGYLEEKRRVRAIRLRGHKSSAILLPVSCLAYAGVDPSELEAGMTFDQVNGREICRKYVVPVKASANRAAKQAKKVFRKVDDRVFPMHVDTANFWRALAELKHYAGELIITQKLHGTSLRAGNVPVLNPPIEPRFNSLRRSLGLKPKPALPATTVWAEDTEFVVGSKRVIKDDKATQGYYGSVDVFTEVANEQLAGKIPENYMVYGEIVGWVPGTDKPIQKGYTYGLPRGQADLYVYRVATINRTGQIADLPWDAVKTFCRERGLKWTPELCRIPARFLREAEDRGVVVFNIEDLLDQRYEDLYLADSGPDWTDRPVGLSDRKTVDEGVCIRQDNGVVPTILKAKSPMFFEHETKQNDKGEVDIETLESEAAA
ncbi:RNA ligase [Gordonia phage Mollymur]|uniref:RNA ligase n=1 Tax=Gordonia phage Mollymur TaxID=2590895 RepID=A0A4Y6E9W0_9CAUD|nr:RNA ligase [Gordonia phage Mollymur]QDF15461.1 RNA ligase [Gordonia phage Mollymur]